MNTQTAIGHSAVAPMHVGSQHRPDVPEGVENSIALGRGLTCSRSNTAVVQTADGVIEFPTVGRASLGSYVTVPTAGGLRHFVGPDERGNFHEVRLPDETQ